MFKRYVFVDGLTSLLYSDRQYYITIFGNIKDKFGNDVLTKHDEDGQLVVNVKSWDGVRDYRVIDLMMFQFKNIQIPLTDYRLIKAFVIDGDKENVHANNIGYRFSGGKLEVNNAPGYFYIPGFTTYAINKNGDLINAVMNSSMSWYITKPQIKKNIKGGYYFSRVNFTKNKTTTISRHRSLCLVFKEYPDNCDSLVVNHINGIPGDDRLENLELITRSGNNYHAYSCGLRNKNRLVLTRDVISGIVTEYNSIAECATQLGYPTDETIRYRLFNSLFSKVFQDGKQFKLKTDKRDWIIPNNPELEISNAKIERPIKARNCRTLEVSSHISISDAGRITGISAANIARRLIKKDYSPLLGYQFMPLDSEQEWPNFTPTDVKRSIIPNKFSVQCRNLLTKETIEFDSVKKAMCSAIGNKGLSNVLREGKQPLLPNGWQFKFPDQQWEDFVDFEKELCLRTKEIEAKDEFTGKIYRAISAREIGRLLRLDHKALRLAALTKGVKVYKGFRFRLGHSEEVWPNNAWM